MNSKRGQATIFILIALAIVAVLVILFVYPNIKGIGGVDAVQNPKVYVEKCVESDLRKIVQRAADAGGDLEPQGYIMYQGKKIKYLCYTNEDYQTCVVQQPLIKDHFDDLINKEIKSKVESCLKDLISQYEKNGWSVSTKGMGMNSEITPDAISIRVNSPMTLTKDVSRTLDSFDLTFQSSMYEILYIANSIVEFEATYGDSETTSYLQYYPDVIIKKNQLGDGSVIYSIENVITHESFTFASRSLAWPPGYIRK